MGIKTLNILRIKIKLNDLDRYLIKSAFYTFQHFRVLLGFFFFFTLAIRDLKQPINMHTKYSQLAQYMGWFLPYLLSNMRNMSSLNC